MKKLFEINTLRFLSVVAHLIRTVGWTSGKEAFNTGIESTAKKAWKFEESLQSVSGIISDTVEEEDKELARKALQWVRSLDIKPNEKNQNYLEGLINACAGDVLLRKGMGFAASAIGAYNKSVKVNKAQAFKNSDFIGEIDEVIETVVRIFQVKQTKYGSWQYSMSDTIGNIFIWYDNSEQLLFENDVINLKAKVKKHNEYMECKQTILKDLVVI
jgi:hypothetical protein